MGDGISTQRVLLGLVSGLLFLAGQAMGITATATIKEVDAEGGVIIVFARGQDRTLLVDGQAKFLDLAGEALPDGIRAEDWKEGAVVTITVEFVDDRPVLKVLQLGGHPSGEDPPSVGRPTVGFKPLDEMTAADRYKGEDGGLYGDGRNEPPPELLAAA